MYELAFPCPSTRDTFHDLSEGFSRGLVIPCSLAHTLGVLFQAWAYAVTSTVAGWESFVVIRTASLAFISRRLGTSDGRAKCDTTSLRGFTPTVLSDLCEQDWGWEDFGKGKRRRRTLRMLRQLGRMCCYRLHPFAKTFHAFTVPYKVITCYHACVLYSRVLCHLRFCGTEISIRFKFAWR